MSRFFRSLGQKRIARRALQRKRRSFVPSLELLESRRLLAVTASFSLRTGILRVLGDNQDNTIEISRNAAGVLQVNGGAVPIRLATATVANTALIHVFGQRGNDTITLNEANGALPRANIYGGAGNDTLTGGAGDDLMFGQQGDDLISGRGGADFLFGGTDDDTMIGGDGDDQIFGETGNDRMIWGPGDDTDLNEGGGGIDTVEVQGGGGSEEFAITANGARVRFDRISPAPFSLDIGTSENLIVSANGGNDSVSAVGNLAALIQITVDGGAGDDVLLGGNGADLLLGGDGDDFIDGNQGNDVILLGAGDDVFQWDPGDGSDVVEGQDGNDRMVFNGSAGSEVFEVFDNGGRVRFLRNLGNIVMDLDDVETIDLRSLGGADSITMSDVSGTDFREFNVDLAGTLGTATGDAQADTITLVGSDAEEVIEIVGTGTSYAVIGLSASVQVQNSEGNLDALIVRSLGGNDQLTAATLPAGIVALILDGGAGDDQLLGSAGADLLLGGDDDDFVDGNQGNDTALLGAGHDTFQWDPGDGSDVVEGQDGEDVMIFNGSNASEQIDVFANGSRVLFFRNVGNISMDLNGVEQIDLHALGGGDTINAGDLSGTDTVLLQVDLAAASGGAEGDASDDVVVVTGTNSADVVTVSGSGTSATVRGLTLEVRLLQAERDHDRLVVNALGGDDTVDASGLAAGVIGLQLNGGLGADVLIGSEDDDLIIGGDGNDLILLGAGDDTTIWNPGDDSDTVEGQAGYDLLVFQGANVSENIDISANGGRVLFFRNIANVTMDLNDVEQIDFNALGGADTMVVNDLSGTDVTLVNFNLAASQGGGDAQPDNVIVQGTNTDDVILVTGSAGEVSVFGLAAEVRITGAEVANDRVTINALGGDDVVEASGLAADAIQLVADGGTGDDVLIGGDGNDVLLGGEGDDVLIGGPGVDILDGGPGDNIVIQ